MVLGGLFDMIPIFRFLLLVAVILGNWHLSASQERDKNMSHEFAVKVAYCINAGTAAGSTLAASSGFAEEFELLLIEMEMEGEALLQYAIFSLANDPLKFQFTAIYEEQTEELRKEFNPLAMNHKYSEMWEFFRERRKTCEPLVRTMDEDADFWSHVENQSKTGA